VLVRMKRTVCQSLYDLHSSRILAIASVRSRSGAGSRSRLGIGMRRRGDLGEMVRDILLGFIRDVGVVKSSLEAGSAGAR